MPAFVVSIDGPDFTGKTTISNLVVEHLREIFPKWIIKKTEVPSSLVTGSFTKILRNSADEVDDEVFALAYAADHLHHDRRFIQAYKKSPQRYIIVQERSLLTTFIYQSLIGQVKLSWLREINKLDRNIPDLQLILKMKLDELMKRQELERRDFDKFETKAHLTKQVQTYYQLPAELKRLFRVQYIEANGNPADVAKDCAYAVQRAIGKLK